MSKNIFFPMKYANTIESAIEDVESQALVAYVAYSSYDESPVVPEGVFSESNRLVPEGWVVVHAETEFSREGIAVQMNEHKSLIAHHF